MKILITCDVSKSLLLKILFDDFHYFGTFANDIKSLRRSRYAYTLECIVFSLEVIAFNNVEGG